MSQITIDSGVSISPDGATLTVKSGAALIVEKGATFAQQGTQTSEGTQSFDAIVGNDPSLGITGAAAADATAVGGAIALAGTDGGSTSGTGGAITSTAGDGSAAAAVGGANTMSAGDGSAGATTVDGGVGGASSLVAGDGGAKTDAGVASGGDGGAIAVTGGVGGASATSNASEVGGTGGAVTVASGAGGAVSAGTGDGGPGGDITLTPGGGGTSAGGNAGAPGDVVISTGVLRMAVQTLGMGSSNITMTLVPGTPTGTLLTGNILYADAEGGTPNLLLPHEADSAGVFLVIENTGGETIEVQDDAGGGLVTLVTAKTAYLTCNGTVWKGRLSN